jgi:oligopeptidase B
MIRLLTTLFTLSLFIGCQQAPAEEATTTSSEAPRAKKVAHTFTEFDQTREDPYFWLSNPKDPEVIEILEAENAFVESSLEHTKGLQDEIYNELISRIEKKFESLPTKNNGYWYYTRYEEDGEYPFYCRKKENLEAEEEIILDVNQMAEGYEVYRLGQYFVSPDNQLVAYLVDTSGDRRNTLFFKDLRTGELLPDQVNNVSYGGAWAADNKTFFYTLTDNTVRTNRVVRHILGSLNTEDVEIYNEPDSTFSAYVYRSDDDRYILVGSGSTTTSEAWFLPADQPTKELTVVQPRKEGLEYSVDSYTGNEFHIRHNHQAKNFMISTASVSNPGMSNWKPLIPHREDVYVSYFTVLEKYLVVQERSRALDKVHVINRESGEEHYLDFGEEVYTASMYTPTDEFDAEVIRYNYQSPTTPRATFSYNLTTREKEMLKQVQVGGGFNSDLYETRRVWVKARDGVEVPLSLVYHKEKYQQDGTNPCLLYSYGSYGSSSMPYFRSNVVSLLDRGFVFAIAHIRGGQEMGRQWYEDGKLLNKKNTFNDFVDCAQYMVDEKYTYTEGLFAMGGSAGGMLMGAIVNMRPDLFKGIIAYVPWMDVITDMFNTELPLTTLEYDEWGDPNEKEYYDYMLSWSPYDNMKEADYPAIFATGGVNDTQVPYYSPAKWVQKARDLNTGDEPILFKVDMGAGHGGVSGRFKSQEKTAQIYSFILDQVGEPVAE